MRKSETKILVALLLFISVIKNIIGKTRPLPIKVYKKFKKAFPTLTEQQYLNAQIIVNTAFAQTQTEQQIVYFLATAYGSSRLFPVKERLAKAGSKVRKYQEKYWDTGYYGRGYVQITWKRSYEEFQGILGIDLINHPELALNPFIASEVMIVGMRRGLFSIEGKNKLDDYLGPGKYDFYNARRTVWTTHDAEMYEAISLLIFNQKVE